MSPLFQASSPFSLTPQLSVIPLMADPAKVLATVRRAIDLFASTPGRVGSVDHLEDADDVLVVGDLHGHVHVFAQALKIAALDRNPRRHVVFQELVHDPRAEESAAGDRSHRLVDVVCALKCQYPDRVHLILGNHELSEMTNRSIAKHGTLLNAMFRQGIEASYGPLATDIHAAYLELFASLPLMARTENRVVLSHTIPDERYLDSIDWNILSTGEWTPDSLLRGGTVYALTWGRDVSIETTDRFAGMVDADFFIVGHHAVDQGFKRMNPRVLILDGTDPLPACCLFPATGKITIETLEAGARIIPRPAS